MSKFTLKINKDNRPFKKSIKYKGSVVLHVPDYIDIKFSREMIKALNQRACGKPEILNL